MARSKITQRGIQATSDNGAILQSLIAGEQTRTEITLKFFTNINGCQVAARLVEADNSGLDYSNGAPIEYPTSVKTGAPIKYLPIVYKKNNDSDYNSSHTIVSNPTGLTTISLDQGYVTNKLEIVWDNEACEGFIPQATPDRPVYAFFALEIRDNATGEIQQIFKPLRGLIEFRYSIDQGVWL